MEALLNNIIIWAIIGFVLLILLTFFVLPLLQGCLLILICFLKAFTWALNMITRVCELMTEWRGKGKFKHGSI